MFLYFLQFPRIIFDRICSPLTLNSQDPVADLQSSDEDLRSRMSELQQLLSEREYFRTKSPPNDSIGDETISPYEKEQHAVVDEYGNPIIPINLNDYLNAGDDEEEDEDQLDLSSHYQIDSDLNFVKFKNHQEELFKMQKQMQIIRQNQLNNSHGLVNQTLNERFNDQTKTIHTEDPDSLSKPGSSLIMTTSAFIKQENVGNNNQTLSNLNCIGSCVSAATTNIDVFTSATSHVSGLPQSSILTALKDAVDWFVTHGYVN